MRKTFLMLAALVAATLLQAQTPDYFVPYKATALRLPSVPLLVNDPYFSFWSPYNKLTDGTVKHWDNQQKAMDGLLRALAVPDHPAGLIGGDQAEQQVLAVLLGCSLPQTTEEKPDFSSISGAS